MSGAIERHFVQPVSEVLQKPELGPALVRALMEAARHVRPDADVVEFYAEVMRRWGLYLDAEADELGAYAQQRAGAAE